jgi:hypothetical protein
MMSKDNKSLAGPEGKTSAASGVDAGRRKLMTVGALLVPAIATLHATPAWAQTDYTMTAYRYGTNAGLCKNPRYDPNAPPGNWKSHEFIECPTQSGRTHEEVGGEQEQGPGPAGF